jgi:hypothetical protein
MNLKASIGSLTGSLTDDTVRIRKLLNYANYCSSTDEATCARIIAFRLISSGIQRGVVDFHDISDLLPPAYDSRT